MASATEEEDDRAEEEGAALNHLRVACGGGKEGKKLEKDGYDSATKKTRDILQDRFNCIYLIARA